MDPTIEELIKNLNLTIKKLTNENYLLKQKLEQYDISAEKSKHNLKFEAKNSADYIITKSLDFAFEIKNDIIDLLKNMQLYSNTPLDLLNIIEVFIKKNQKIFLVETENGDQLTDITKQKIYQKIIGNDSL